MVFNSYFNFLRKHKGFTAVNVMGLCLSLMFLILLGDLIYRETSVESYQTRGDRIYAVGNERFMMSHWRVGQKLQDGIPEIEDHTAVTGYELSAENLYGEHVKLKVLVGESNFFRFFDYKLLQGNPDKVLESPNQVVITQSFANKYYKDQDPIGQELKIFGGNTFTISGIMADFDRSVIPGDYEALIHIDNLKEFHPSAYGEEMDNAACAMVYVLGRENTDLTTKTQEMRNVLKDWWVYKMDIVKEVKLVPYSRMYYDAMGAGFNDGDLNHGSEQMTWLYMAIGLLVLVFALFNYVNLSVSLTTARSKEMAMRRLLGSKRMQVFARLILECIMLTAVAFVLAYLLALALQDEAMELANCKLDVLKDTSPLVILGSILLIGVVGLLAGFVPATILSGYQPIDIVRGTFRRKVRQRWSHVLIVTQTVFCLVMLTTTLLLNAGIKEKMSRPLGYNIENVWEISNMFGDDYERMQSFRDRVKKLPEVVEVGFGFSTPISFLENSTFEGPNGAISRRLVMGDSAYFNILGYHPIKRNDVPPSSDGVEVGFNREMLRQLSLTEDAKEVMIKNEKWDIPAVYPDVVYQNVMSEEENPTPIQIMKVNEMTDEKNRLNSKYGAPAGIYVQFTGDAQQVKEKLMTILHNMTPNTSFEPDLLSDYHDGWYKDYKRFLRVLDVFTLVALLINILGLLAMNSYYVEQRRKEIAIRKVFGSTTRGILTRLLRVSCWQFVAALVIAVPLAWYLAPIVGSLSGLPLQMQVLPFVCSALLASLVIFATIGLQSWRAATSNPIEGIKTE